MEDVTLAVDLLQASLVAELADCNVKDTQPDKVYCDQGQSRETDDNLHGHGQKVSNKLSALEGSRTARPAAWPFWKV